MPFWGNSDRSNKSNATGGTAEVNIRIATETAASATQNKRGGAASAEEERALKLANDALEAKLAKAKRDEIDAYHASMAGNL